MRNSKTNNEMTNAELIQAIRNEIERLKGICTTQIKENPGQTFPFVMVMTGYDNILSFLSTLEPEKPNSQNENFEKEIADYWTTMGWSKVMTLAKFKVIARYFYGLGLGVNDKSEKPVPKDIEEAAVEYEKRVIEETKCHHNALTYAEGYEDALLLIPGAFIDGAKWQKEQMMEDLPKWKKIKAGERLPCPAYVWTIAYDNYPDCFEGRLMPNIQGVKVGRDTWYLPVDVIHNLPKED